MAKQSKFRNKQVANYEKIFYLFVFILICFSSACSFDKSDVNTESELIEIIDSGMYYRVYKESINQFRYDIYNADGEIVLSEKTDRPFSVKMINDDVIDIEIGMGTGIAIHKYHSVEKNIFSKEFSYVLSNSDKLIAYIDVAKEKPLEERKIIVQNIFDKTLFFKEYELNFSKVDTPVLDAAFSKDETSLQLLFLSGEEQIQSTAIFDLTQ